MRTTTLVLVLAALGLWFGVPRAQADDARHDARIKRLEAELAALDGKKEKDWSKERSWKRFELVWKIQMLHEAKRKGEKVGKLVVPEPKLEKLPERYKWKFGGFFSGKVFLVEDGFETMRLGKYLDRRLRDGPRKPGSQPTSGKANQPPQGSWALKGKTLKVKGKTFKLVIAKWSDDRGTTRVTPLVAVHNGRVEIRVRRYYDGMPRTTDYRPGLNASTVTVTVPKAGTYTIDIGYGVVGKVVVE